MPEKWIPLYIYIIYIQDRTPPPRRSVFGILSLSEIVFGCEMSFSIPNLPIYLSVYSVCIYYTVYYIVYIYIEIIIIIILRLVGRCGGRAIVRAANATMSVVIYFKPFMSAGKKMWFILVWIYIYIYMCIGFRTKIAW